MSHRAHLFSVRIANAIQESCFQERYTWQRFSRDLVAGATVGVIAIPLAMALAIASGVPPQHGLYTAMIAGFIIALIPNDLPEGWAAYRISGPLFFAAADRVFSELTLLAADKRGVILNLDGVALLDAGGLSALTKFINACSKYNTKLVMSDIQFQPLKTLARAGTRPIEGLLIFAPTLDEAVSEACSPADAIFKAA